MEVLNLAVHATSESSPTNTVFVDEEFEDKVMDVRRFSAEALEEIEVRSA